MFAVLCNYGIPKAVVIAISTLYGNSRSVVMVDGSISDPFVGVPQGDVLAPFLFIILVAFLLAKATSDIDSGVVTHPRRSRRYPAKVLNDLDFADDIALLESTLPLAQASIPEQHQQHKISTSYLISVPKKEYTTVNGHPMPPLQVYGEAINHVMKF